jgi:hypothetical protein
MNDFDEFAEIALAIFFALTLLIWLLTYMERTLIDPASPQRLARSLKASGFRPTRTPQAMVTSLVGMVSAIRKASIILLCCLDHGFVIAVEPVGDVCGINRPSRIPMPSW